MLGAYPVHGRFVPTYICTTCVYGGTYQAVTSTHLEGSAGIAHVGRRGRPRSRPL